MALHHAVLGERSEVGVVPPDPCRWSEHRILAGQHPGVRRIPVTGMGDDGVAEPHMLDALAYGRHDARGVAAADVKVVGLAGPLAHGDHVHRDSPGRPHVVVVDPGRLNLDEHLPGPGRRGVDLLDAESLARSPESLDPDHLRGHAPGDVGDHFRGSRVAHGQLLR